MDFIYIEKELREKYKFHTIQYPGRGKRKLENYAASWENLIDDCYKQLIDYVSDEYIIVGYSMGAIIAYELYKKLRENNDKQPRHIFFCSSRAPQKISRQLSILEKDEFKQAVIDFGGVPDFMIESEKVLNEVLSVVKHDVDLLETYEFEKSNMYIDIPVTVTEGDRDIYCHQSEDWQHISRARLGNIVLSGGHFFIFEQRKMFLDILVNTLNDLGENK